MITDAAKLKAAATYNAAADHFDDDPLGFWARIGRRTIDRLELPPGATVLDVGCGTGASALPAAKKVGPQGRVIGVDLAERLLEIARQKAESRQLANTRFEVGDMERLGYPDDHFHAVVSVFSIFFVADMASKYANCGAWFTQAGGWLSRLGVPGCSSLGRPFGGTR
jgi:ubiquinone/menaquinone biosynthesis C-methylase UbiE